ncbi:TetR family transcriptional regulator [Mycolicibacillus parakoreensis]|uniref:TetR family transcriptional regulator n=1 Tax=Mycolicibacillus parakoreensis TaxID=1069221 RepID=A0ABY3U345_9MYCO|nr:TetR family transcriptional regulator [Mycolicibacillus parakoreensis]MCV7314343.1 TetR family transcriptional regulator [Mycolicibacillus parakoreensis]ULN53308.1 TetR family transcriptional regulator [Mycolicibacillus parakoreensis]
MSTSTGSRGSARADSTRGALLTAAERLFAEHGVEAVTHRQIVQGAGQGNNAAVAYHFGTKKDLVRAIHDRHAIYIEELRAVRISETGESADLRDWVSCLVRPLTDYLASLPGPTWYARFAAQVMTDPTYQRVVTKNSLESESMRRVVERIGRIPQLPNHVRAERVIMMRTMLVYTCAAIERGFAEDAQGPRADWHGAASGLIDGIVGVWQAPVTDPPARGLSDQTGAEPAGTW